MKLLKYLLPLLFVVAGCQELDKVTAPDPAQTSAPVLGAIAPLQITDENLTTQAVFTWTPADYGFQAAPTYTLMAQVGSGEAVEVTTGFGNSASLSYESLNRGLVAAGAQPEVATDVIFTLTALLSPSYAAALVSAPVTARMTAYAPPTTYLWLAGNFTAVGWNPGAANAPILTSIAGGAYEGLVNMISDGALEFKVCKTPDWSNSLGGTSTTLGSSDGNITDIASGYYRMIIDANVTRVVSTLKINTIGAIGDATPGGWDTETKLTLDPATNTWVIPSIAITGGGGFKLRINDDWGQAIGGTTDQARFGGDQPNISAPATSGNYRMTFHANQFPYKITFEPL